MPKLNLSPYQSHVARWKACKLCPLHSTRKQVVIARGKVPAEVVMVGEAPGLSEDTLGQPFVGPAGQLLDRMIGDAISDSGVSPAICYTNIVACVPKAPDTKRKKGEPVKAEIDACYPRLDEFFNLNQSKLELIVAVGSLSAKQAKIQGWGERANVVEIVHPSFILHQTGQTGLLIQRVIIQLTDAFENLRNE